MMVADTEKFLAAGRMLSTVFVLRWGCRLFRPAGDTHVAAPTPRLLINI